MQPPVRASLSHTTGRLFERGRFCATMTDDHEHIYSLEGIDSGGLTSFLTDALDEEVTGRELLDGALNVVVEISTAAGNTYVLRQPAKLREVAYMNSLCVEYEVLERLAETAVPAPKPVLYCADESLLGEPFFLMAALEGTEIQRGNALQTWCL
ncbi:hypothetical protein BRD08_09025 [Halobacteriales archaeon SW_10_66_29]|nr:MAG: hypothetical protein BRD08_09025 [Halobacteriales archaeon SW_10_66_29]